MDSAQLSSQNIKVCASNGQTCTVKNCILCISNGGKAPKLIVGSSFWIRSACSSCSYDTTASFTAVHNKPWRALHQSGRRSFSLIKVSLAASPAELLAWNQYFLVRPSCTSLSARPLFKVTRRLLSSSIFMFERPSYKFFFVLGLIAVSDAPLKSFSLKWIQLQLICAFNSSLMFLRVLVASHWRQHCSQPMWIEFCLVSKPCFSLSIPSCKQSL